MTAKSRDTVAAALSTVLRDQGWAVAASTRRLRAGMSDLLGADVDGSRGDLDALLVVVDEGLVVLLRETDRERVPEVVPAMVARLGEWGLAPETAEWALRTWLERIPPPAPSTIEPPDTRTPFVGPTTLPPVATDPTVLPPPVLPPTVAPPTVLPSTPERGTARRWRHRPGRRAAGVAAALAVVLVVGGVAAANWPDDRGREKGGAAGTADGPGASVASGSATSPIEAGTVVAAPGTSLPAVDRPAAMGSRSAGVRLVRLGEVDQVETADGPGAAPEGGRLIGFRLADGPCERTCGSWSDLALRVRVGGEQERLSARAGDGTFVVAVPPGGQDVELVLKADGLTQTLSLVDGSPGPDNVVVLARAGRVDRVDETFTLVERTSEAFDYGGTITDTVPRTVTVSRAELTFFTEHGRASSPDSALLRVRARYRIPYADAAYGFDVRELRFVARDGTTYRARDVDGGSGVSAMFDVPADLRGGVLHIGGTYVTSSNGLTYTVTLQARAIPLRFG